MKNQREAWAALTDGKKLRHKDFAGGEFVFFNNNGFLVDEKGRPIFYDFSDHFDWEIYKEPEVYELECEWATDEKGLVAPCLANPPFDWHSLSEKTTKLRIEVVK
jgi:hypothetical protein